MTSFEALIVAVCAAAAISKPVQEKLANFVPSFLNDQGHRSAIGLASTGMVAASSLLPFEKIRLNSIIMFIHSSFLKQNRKREIRTVNQLREVLEQYQYSS